MSSQPDPESHSANQPSAAEDSSADVALAVEELLNTLSNKFAGVSSEIFAKMDDMSRRIDLLESAMLENKSKDGGSKS